MTPTRRSLIAAGAALLQFVMITAFAWPAARTGPRDVPVVAAGPQAAAVAEGLARDLVRVIQDSRKDIGCAYTDRIEIGLVTTSAELRRACENFRDYIMAETLAVTIVFEPLSGIAPVELKFGDAALQLFVRVVS